MNEALPIRFTKRADRHIDEALAWWTRNRAKSPGLLAEALEEAFVLISSQPHIGAPARNVRLAGTRRVYLHRIGYSLYYRVQGEPPEMVQVVAFWHSSRERPPL
jgi:plasmid stabilization system protein ParE